MTCVPVLVARGHQGLQGSLHSGPSGLWATPPLAVEPGCEASYLLVPSSHMLSLGPLSVFIWRACPAGHHVPDAFFHGCAGASRSVDGVSGGRCEALRR